MSIEWRDNAACIGMPIEWFFPVSKEDPGYEEKTVRQLKVIQNEHLARGLEACASCPVRQECGEDGSIPSETDEGYRDYPALHSVRGGKLPELFKPKAPGRPSKGDVTYETNLRGDRVCLHAHVSDWAADSKGKRFCRSCKAEQARERHHRDGGMSAEQYWQRKLDTHPEKYGHEYKVETDEKTGERYCFHCSEARKQARYEDGVKAHLSRYGHEFRELLRNDGVRYCGECNIARSRRYREKRAAKIAAGSIDPEAKHLKDYGHDYVTKLKPSGVMYCGECARIRKQKYRDAEKKKKYLARLGAVVQ